MIIQSRLKGNTVVMLSQQTGLQAFDPSAIELCSMKVASISGDARRALELCRRATAIAEVEVKRKMQENVEIEGEEEQHLVQVRHIDEAMEQMFFSVRTQEVKNASRQEKIFLCAVLLEISSTGLNETTLEKVRCSDLSA